MENEAVARYRRRRPGLLVAAGIRTALAARIDRSANGIGALRHAGRGYCWRPVLPGLFVPQSCHRDRRRDFHAVAAMEAAGHSRVRHRCPAGVRYVRTCDQRGDAAAVSSGGACGHRCDGRIAVAARPRGLVPDRIIFTVSWDSNPAARVLAFWGGLLCMGLFSRFLAQALPCTAEGTLCRVRATRLIVSRAYGTNRSNSSTSCYGGFLALPLGSLTRMCVW